MKGLQAQTRTPGKEMIILWHRDTITRWHDDKMTWLYDDMITRWHDTTSGLQTLSPNSLSSLAGSLNHLMLSNNELTEVSFLFDTIRISLLSHQLFSNEFPVQSCTLYTYIIHISYILITKSHSANQSFSSNISAVVIYHTNGIFPPKTTWNTFIMR